MSNNNYLKFMTEEVVKYFNLPREARKEQRLKEKSTNQLYSHHWFGVFPFSVKLFLKNKN